MGEVQTPVSNPGHCLGLFSTIFFWCDTAFVGLCTTLIDAVLFLGFERSPLFGS